MKTTELKIGDWVYFDNPAREEKEVAKVVAILNDVQLNIVRLEDNTPLLVVASDIVPIPLTKEILEKNGWRKDADATLWVLGYLGLYWFMVDGYYELCYADGCMKPIAQTRVEYVHQLQHLLWALGMNDDLKI